MEQSIALLLKESGLGTRDSGLSEGESLKPELSTKTATYGAVFFCAQPAYH